MASEYLSWAEEVKRLARAIEALVPAAQAAGVALPDGREWYELLRRKLAPQLELPPALVVAVTGGTNIGKSAIFNHLAGENASAVSPLAAGTKHPVCLVPQGWAEATMLGRLFETFTLRAWHDAQDPLVDAPEHILFWRASRSIAERLLMLDTPDIDSDVEVNWRRADVIRQSADVLIAVLTQQKYNDAAVKRFFRKAAEADKPVIVVFNQCDLVEDRAAWPQWLATFVGETGVDPCLVYVVAYDRAAVHDMRLSFHDVGLSGRDWPEQPSDVREDLASLHFDAIKLRTLRGALAEVIDLDAGAARWLAEVGETSARFATALRSLSTSELVQVRWPGVPAPLLVEEIRSWWDATHRRPWARSINRFYRQAAELIALPFRAARKHVAAPPSDLEVDFRRREREAILEAVERLLGAMQQLSEVGNELLWPRIAALMTGTRRSELVDRIRAAHDELPAVGDDYRTLARQELETWSRDNPRAVGFLRSIDHAAALARPALSVSLAVTGGWLAVDYVGQAAAQLAGHTAGQLAAEAAIVGGVTVGGEAAVGAAGKGIGQAAAALFQRLQRRYAQTRADWLARWLEANFLGELLADLSRGASLAQRPELAEAERSLAVLRRGLP